MKQIKVSEATELQLDWLVAKSEGKVEQGVYGTPEFRDGAVHLHYCDATLSGCYSPSTNWAQGGPIIEREKISTQELEGVWSAFFREKLFEEDGSEHWMDGPSPLIAAMRCYVASKLGDKVEVPEELL